MARPCPDLDVSRLPASVVAIAEAIGTEPALALLRQYRGRRVSIPVRLPEGHPLIDAVGREAAEALVRRCGGERLHIPVARGASNAVRDEQIRQRRRAGRTCEEIAAELALNERTVRRILRAQT